ncbi:MAG: DUF1178 family protein [Alphaproteobacteria bacterium]|nr:DUF1178 family protein [Alphaproteobacteria bacterium]MDE1986707.1 DUF1178 family protein [Alphaproteobacteria bacterium]MDE2161946.1 DUF1178 family protein [Alphaproteobacteria bacterium]MDE2264467.1 DUF1178 family protein [Alphaproteobacteria bacterium]MDE2500907.1 DUF1178 family protein [Alphaproteobacteria bacterium]
MIVYNLKCGRGHEFEGWFKDSAAYDEQATDGKLTCPMCTSRKVEKAMMAPALAGTKKSLSAKDELKKMRQFVSGMRKYVEENAEYVGPKFPEEARKIHYGETEERHIYGEATLKEAKDLIEEGVDVAALPPDVDEVAN